MTRVNFGLEADIVKMSEPESRMRRRPRWLFDAASGFHPIEKAVAWEGSQRACLAAQGGISSVDAGIRTCLEENLKAPVRVCGGGPRHWQNGTIPRQTVQSGLPCFSRGRRGRWRIFKSDGWRCEGLSPDPQCVAWRAVSVEADSLKHMLDRGLTGRWNVKRPAKSMPRPLC